MTAQWLPANDLLKTDWDIDPRNRPRQPKNDLARFPCTYDLGNNKGICKEVFSEKVWLNVHMDEDHLKVIDLKPYSREPAGRDDPMFSDFGLIDRGAALREGPGDAPEPEWHPNVLSGRWQKRER